MKWGRKISTKYYAMIYREREKEVLRHFRLNDYDTIPFFTARALISLTVNLTVGDIAKFPRYSIVIYVLIKCEINLKRSAKWKTINNHMDYLHISRFFKYYDASIKSFN